MQTDDRPRLRSSSAGRPPTAPHPRRPPAGAVDRSRVLVGASILVRAFAAIALPGDATASACRRRTPAKQRRTAARDRSAHGALTCARSSRSGPPTKTCRRHLSEEGPDRRGPVRQRVRASAQAPRPPADRPTGAGEGAPMTTMRRRADRGPTLAVRRAGRTSTRMVAPSPAVDRREILLASARLAIDPRSST